MYGSTHVSVQDLFNLLSSQVFHYKLKAAQSDSQALEARAYECAQRAPMLEASDVCPHTKRFVPCTLLYRVDRSREQGSVRTFQCDGLPRSHDQTARKRVREGQSERFWLYGDIAVRQTAIGQHYLATMIHYNTDATRLLRLSLSKRCVQYIVCLSAVVSHGSCNWPLRSLNCDEMDD